MNGGSRSVPRPPVPVSVAGRSTSVRSTHVPGGHVLGAESVGQGAVTAVGALQQQREVLRRLQEFQGRSQTEWDGLMKCKALWETEKAFLQKQLNEWESKYEVRGWGQVPGACGCRLRLVPRARLLLAQRCHD